MRISETESSAPGVAVGARAWPIDPTPGLEASPVQVRRDPPAPVLRVALEPGEPGGRRGDAAVGLGPTQAVVDHLLGVLGQVVEDRAGEGGGHGVRPPDVRRQVADLEPADGERQVLGRVRTAAERDLLGAELRLAAGLPHEGRGVDLGRARVVVGDQQQHPRRMDRDDLGDQRLDLGGALRGLAVDDQVRHPGAVDGRVAGGVRLVEEPRERGLDVGQRDVDRAGDDRRGRGVAHSVLHDRWSASISRSASSGPQVPA